MEALIRARTAAEISADNSIAAELVPLIRKLRWMGMDDEVERAQRRLALCRAPLTDCVPRDTD